MKDPHAVALGRKAKGKPKTLTPASIAARQANAAKGRAVMKARREEGAFGDSVRHHQAE
jgi:hypothetical protein